MMYLNASTPVIEAKCPLAGVGSMRMIGGASHFSTTTLGSANSYCRAYSEPKEFLISSKRLIFLVAGEGFEPPTKGL